MNDDSTQPDEEQRVAPKHEERRDAHAGTLPWLDGAVEELFRAAPLPHAERV